MQQLGQQSPGAYDTSYAQEPQPTDMQTLLQRASEVEIRLNSIYISLADMIGRLYGEGQGVQSELKPAPRSAGLVSEMSENLSRIEMATARIDEAVKRLAMFA